MFTYIISLCKFIFDNNPFNLFIKQIVTNTECAKWDILESEKNVFSVPSSGQTNVLKLP